jgi:hypothetical protein
MMLPCIFVVLHGSAGVPNESTKHQAEGGYKSC